MEMDGVSLFLSVCSVSLFFVIDDVSLLLVRIRVLGS